MLLLALACMDQKDQVGNGSIGLSALLVFSRFHIADIHRTSRATPILRSVRLARSEVDVRHSAPESLYMSWGLVDEASEAYSVPECSCRSVPTCFQVQHDYVVYEFASSGPPHRPFHLP